MFVYREFLLTLIYFYECVSQNVNNNDKTFLLNEQLLNNITVPRSVVELSLPVNNSDTFNFYNSTYLNDSFNIFQNTNVSDNSDRNVSYLNSSFQQNNVKVWENLIKYGKENINVLSFNNTTENSLNVVYENSNLKETKTKNSEFTDVITEKSVQDQFQDQIKQTIDSKIRSHKITEDNNKIEEGNLTELNDEFKQNYFVSTNNKTSKNIITELHDGPNQDDQYVELNHKPNETKFAELKLESNNDTNKLKSNYEFTQNKSNEIDGELKEEHDFKSIYKSNQENSTELNAKSIEDKFTELNDEFTEIVNEDQNASFELNDHKNETELSDENLSHGEHLILSHELVHDKLGKLNVDLNNDELLKINETVDQINDTFIDDDLENKFILNDMPEVSSEILFHELNDVEIWKKLINRTNSSSGNDESVYHYNDGNSNSSESHLNKSSKLILSSYEDTMIKPFSNYSKYITVNNEMSTEVSNENNFQDSVSEKYVKNVLNLIENITSLPVKIESIASTIPTITLKDSKDFITNLPDLTEENFTEFSIGVASEKPMKRTFSSTLRTTNYNSTENFIKITSTVLPVNKTEIKLENKTKSLPNQTDVQQSTVSEYQNDTPDEDVTTEEENGVSLAFVFDATGSMWDDLVQVREGATKILQAMLDRPDKLIYDYVLVPFRDPEIGPPTVTRDHGLLKQMLNEIQVYGGNDCPEMSVGAVKLALELSRSNSYIYVFTDASAKDYKLIDEVLPLIQEKLSKVVFVMTGDCGSPNLPGYLVYQRIAATSSGQVYHLEKSDVNEVLNYIRLSLLPHKQESTQKVNLLSVDHLGSGFNSNKPRHNLSLPIDKSLSEFTVSVSGRKASLGVVDPHGVPAGPPQVTEMLNLENVKVINVKEPDPGLWTLKVGSDSQYTVRSTGVSSSDFGYGFTSLPTYNKNDTSLRPLKDKSTNLLIWATEPDNLKNFASCELIGTNGKIYINLPLEPIEGQIGLYKTKTFVPPNEFFYLTVHGISTDDHPFKRITPTAVASVKPERAGISADQIVEAEAYQPTSLSCYVKSLLPYDVVWLKNGKKIGKMQHYLQTAHVTLDFPTVLKSDNGVYACRVNNSAGLSQKQIKLIVKGDPPLVRSEKNVKATPGSGAILNCIVESSLPYNISWKKLNGPNKVDLHTWIQNGAMKLLHDNSLLIEEVSFEDEGWYVCVAQSDGGIGTGNRIRLLLQEKPQVVVYPEKHELPEGEAVTLSCHVLKGIPNPKLSWEKDGDPIDGDKRFITEVINNTRTSVLKLKSGFRNDEGIYRCIAQNEIGVGYASATIIFLLPPVVEVEDQKSITVNGTASGILHCRVTDVPNYNLSWVRGDVSHNPEIWNKNGQELLNNDPTKYRIHSNGSLEIFFLNPTDQGWYTCCADYKGLTGTNVVYLAVKEIPRVYMEHPVLNFRKGNDLTIKCIIKAGYPNPTVHWYRNGYPMASYNNLSRIEQRNNTSILIYRQPQKEDSGKYECRASNNFGVDSAVTEVNYIELPTVISNERRKLVKEGDRAIFSCDVTGEPKPNVRWFKDSQEVLPNSVQQPYIILYNSSLQILSVDKISAGVYICRAENSVGSAEDYTSLEVGSAPVIVPSPNDTDIEIDKSGSLYCEATGLPKPVISWARKDDPTPLDNAHFTTTDYGRLIVKGASMNVQGVYVCTAENVFGKATYETKVTVTGLVPPLIERDQNNSVLENSIELKRIIPGEQVEFDCRISQGKPKPTVNWYFNGHPISVRKGGHFGFHNGSLIIPSVTNNLEGLYECVMSNVAGVDKKYTRLETFKKPVIHGGSPYVQAVIGRDVELECNVTGDPVPTVSWKHLGYHQLPVGQITNSGSLVLKNVAIDDEGSYICTATNIAGSASWATSLTVIVPPVLEKNENNSLENGLELIRVTPGQHVELPCRILQGKPKPSVNWFYNEKPVSSIQGGHYFGYGNGSLVLPSVNNSAEGVYECVVNNAAGEDRKFIKLETFTKPFIHGGLPHVQAVTGGMVELNCNATGDPPPVITWQRFGNRPLPLGQITNTGSFVIKNVTVNEEGSYVCIANNIAGSANSATSLTVIVPPEIVSLPSELSIMEGQMIELDCEATGKPQPSIKWMKGNQPVSVAPEGSTDQLLRFAVSGNDTGIFSCLATNIGGSDRKSVSVTVLVPPRIINGEEETIQVIENSDTILNCNASGYPPPAISWSWKESDLTTIPDTSEHRSLDGTSLLIKNASVDLSGIYVCDAENLAGIAQKIFNLEVLVMPKILDTFPSVINLTVGDDFPLSCKASGHPTPTVFWQKEDFVLRPGHQLGNLVVMQDHTLVLWNATLDSSGTYSCNAYNPAGVASRNHTFNVIAAPTLMDSNVTRVEVQETHNGLLTCPITSGDSPTSIVWLKDGQPVDFRANERADDVHFLAAENSRTLNIVEARASDGGVYTCIAQNPAGTTQAKFTVDITAPPYFVNEYPELTFVVNQGEIVTFDCVVAGNPTPKVNWHNLEKNLPVTSYTTPGAILDSSKQKLIIGSAKHHHNGKYRCSVFNTLDNLQRTFKLTVVGSPEIEGSAEETIELIVGESYNLVCSITGTPLPTYSWYFNSTQDGKRISLNKNSDLLKLTNVTISNNGTFTCMANNTAGSQIKRFNVIVIGPPKIEDSDFIEDVRVKSSEFLKLSCVVFGAPEPTITWLRNGVITKGLIVDKKPEVINDTYSITLPALSGKYSCMASNKAGVAEKQFNVKVLVAPQWAKQKEYFSNGNLQPVEGQPLTIKCPVTGNPPPDISWLLNGVPVNGSKFDKDTIHFDITDSEQSGNYTCVAVNHAGNFSKSFRVDILVPPTFLNKEEIIDIRVPTNTTVKFNCSVSGNPAPQILWLRGFATLPSKNSSQILEMESVSVDDSGEYSCLASNLAGDAEKTFRLQVLEPPAMDEETITSVSNLTVKLHRRVAIKCPLYGSPLPKITWHKDGKVITSDAKNMVEISQDERQLQIMHAVAEDAGSYRCVAENQAGIKELLFDLTVVVPLEWSEWADWGPCSVSCGGGGQERKRYCGGNSNSSKEISDSVSSPLVVLDKSNCLGDYMQHRKCNIAPCQMDDGWTDWSNWSSCSATCGESQKQRVRECRTTRPALDGLPCIGPAIELESCQVPDCTYWGDWSEWSDCSATCGYGTKFRERKCLKIDGVCDGQYREVVSCNVHRCPVDGSWSSWGEWSSCSVTCGRGIRRRIRMCIQPKYGGKRCEGDNLEIEKCRVTKCHKDVPRRANLAIHGELNGERIKPTKVSAEIKKFRGKRVVSASVDDMLKQQAGWFPYLTFLMPPVTWNVAEEEGSSNNGYSLTDGNFKQESKFQFATGHELFVDSKGQGINPKSGALEVEIEVIGEIPLAQPKSTVFIEPFTEDFVQTDKNKLFASSNSTIDVDGELVPYQWNKTVMYDTELGTMPYLVERLSTDEIEAEYDSRNHKVHYSAATSISSPYSKDTCPKGFVLDERYQHCKDIDECNDKTHKCHKTQICENLFGSYKCHCLNGFKSAGQGKRCTDINECNLHKDKCSHFCTNTRGSYKCSCPDGMSLGSDQKTCYDEYGNNQDYSAYPDSDTADDWGGKQSMNNNYRPETGGYNQNYYDDYTPARRSKSSDYDRYQEFEKPAESWACPPGHIKEGTKCVDVQTKGHCTIDRCSEYETCLPTYNGHRCVQSLCPVNYHRDYRTKKCIQFCNEGVCVNGATNSEEIMFVPLPLEITTVQRYQDLLELSVQGDPNGVIFTITENYGNLPLRVRIENGHGVLYSMKFFDVEGIQKVVVVATTYEADHETPLFVNSFEIFLYDPSSL